MKTTRVYATACLFVSSVALIAAANLSFGDEPGVTRLSGYRPQVEGGDPGVFPAPVPDASGYAGAPQMGEPVMGAPGVVYDGGTPMEMGDPMMGSPYPQPGNYAPYFDRSFGATEMVPEAMQGRQPFGPMLMFEQNIDDGLGYDKASSRLNARIPYHLFPNTTVMMADLSAAVTSNGSPYYNYGLVYRNYDAALNRIFGVNAFGDYDEGFGNRDWNRVTVGFESLGKYIDWRANGYMIVGEDSVQLSSVLTGDPRFSGSNVVRNRQRIYDNAYSGFDIETGGPLPLLGRYGLNMYAGAYVLGNSDGYDTVGFQARWQALVTESLSVNTYLTTDDTFGTNSWVSLAYTIPNYRDRRFLKPTDVRERLQDPVMRSNRIHTNIDTKNNDEALLNKNGLAYTVMHVDPNAATAGVGTFENPYRTFQQAANNNNALIDTIYVNPRDDDSGTNLTAVGGITLFDCQTLMSSTRDLTFTSFDGTVYTIPGTPTTTNLGPLISDPNMLAGGSVVRLANQNTVLGMRIDASNAANTVFGNAIMNTAPITDVNIISNTLTDYVTGASLQNTDGRVLITGNTFSGRAGTSVDGLNFTTAAGSTANLLVRQNTATANSGTGLSIVAKSGSTINADNPDSLTVPTGVLNNTTTGGGTGILMEARSGATISGVVEGNTSTGNTVDGFVGRSDGGIFRLASLSGNQFNNNTHHGAYIHYLNNGRFTSVSEDLDRDGNLDAGEDLNGNGRLDRGIIRNNFNNNLAAGICIFGEDAVDNGAAGAGAPDSFGMFDIGDGSGAVGATGSGNNLFGNGVAGIAYDLTGFSTGQINALNNNIQGQFRGLSFLIDGNTFGQPFSLTNTSASLDITRLTLNILPSGNIWDTTAADPGAASIPFQPLNDSGVTTGLVSVNGTLVDPASNPLVAAGGGALVGGGVADATGLLDLQFTSFGVTEEFRWDIDGDPVGSPDGATTGDSLIGSTIQLQFSDGSSLSGALQAVAGNADAAQFVASSGTNTADGIVLRGQGNSVFLASDINNNRITRNGGRGVDVQMLGNARAEDLDLKANTVSNNGLGGVRLYANGPGAFINASQTIGGAGNVNLGYGNLVSAANEFNNNTGDGLRVHAEGGGVIRGNVINNQIRDNTGNGINMIADSGASLDFGTTVAPPASRIISGNTISGNDGAGIQLTSNVTATTVNRVDATVRGNTISGNNLGGVVSVQTGTNVNAPVAPAVANNTVNLTIGGALTTDTNTINENGDVGIGVNVSGNGFANVGIRNATITGTTNGPDPILNGDGINFRRSGSALLIATVEDVTATGNAGDGLDVEAQGNDKTDINQPSPGTVSSVTWSKNNFSDNTLNGARFRVQGEASLIADGTTNTLNGNDQNGILVQTSETATFGDPTAGPAPGTRVVFDGNVMDENAIDGLQISATGNSKTLLTVTSTAVAPPGGPHAALNAGGNTSISRNGRDGVRITTNGAETGVVEDSDILITSDTAQTTIDGNGTVAGGNGVRWDASGRSNAKVKVAITNIRNSIAGVTESTANNGNGVLDIASGEDLNGNGILDSGEDGNGVLDLGEDQNGNGTLDAGEDRNSNGDVDVVDGDGIQANFTGNTTAALTIGGVGEGNVIQSNADDGIAITATGRTPENFNWLITSGAAVTPVDLTTFGPFGPVQKPTPTITIAGNTIGGENNGVAAGNGGDGISINTLGGTDIGTLPENVDSTISTTDASDPFVTYNFGAIETGAIPKVTISNNVITRNARRGANVLLTGAGGTRNRELGAAEFDPIEVSFTDNTISANGMEGIFYRADSDMTQNRFVYLPNFPIVGPPADDNQNYSPFRAEFMALNNGSVNGNTSYMAPYLNLRTVQNSLLTVTGNTIQNNGVAGSTGEGLLIKVGTGAYVAADVRGNTFGGNLEEDFRTASFVSADETFISVDNTGDGTFDFMYLDDTAQLDLRFQDNTGNQIDAFSGGDDEILAEAGGALYTNLDQLKDDGFFPGINVDVRRRQTDLFQVENGPNLNDPNNLFISSGITQDINNNFSFRNGNVNYNVRAAADPLFPNIGFAPFLP
jgi:hypothetical protein